MLLFIHLELLFQAQLTLVLSKLAVKVLEKVTAALFTVTDEQMFIPFSPPML